MILTSKKEDYQGITESFIFSIVKIRPNIAFATFVTSSFAKI